MAKVRNFRAPFLASAPIMATSIAAIDSARGTRINREHVGWLAFGLLLAVYCGFFAQLTSYPYQDFVDHLARAVVMSDLMFDHGARFGDLFELRFMPIPYLLGDVALAALVKLLGPSIAAALWMTLVLVSMPLALVFYTHLNGPRGDRRIFVLLLSLYLATDWFFLLGFTQFRLGLALMIVAMACADRMRDNPSRTAFAALCAALLVGYFTHLASIVFVAPALGVSGLVRLLYRRTTLRREIAIFAPVAAILLWHFGYADHAYRGDALPAYPYDWGTLDLRIWELEFELLRFGRPPGKLLMILFALAVCWGLWRDLRWRNLLQPRVVEMAALAATFLGIYFVLPNSYADASYVAVRALALVALFVVLGRAYLGADEHATEPVFLQTFAVPLAALLAMLNLMYLSVHLTRQNAFAAEYRRIVAQIPRGATVLPVYTGGREGMVRTRLHLGALAVMDRDAMVPYMFAGDAGHPMKYFRYRHRLYAPPEHWYTSTTTPVMVAWRPIACSYQYLLMAKPYDARKLSVRTSVRAENGSAALLAIHPEAHQCEGAREGGAD